MSGQMFKLTNIAGGEYSDWIYDTDEYTVAEGFSAYAFQPGGSGATINTLDWLSGPDGRNDTATTVATPIAKCAWIDQSVDTGPITFAYPVTHITLSAGSGLIYCIKDNINQ